jgi:hypothetical protein
MTVGRIPNVEGGIQPTLLTTAGDIMYASSASNPARLGIGTAGQVLQVNSGATAPEWATPASATWTSFTPAFTNLTVGNATLVGKYINVNKTVLFYVQVTFGSTTSMGTAATLTLPVSAASATASQGGVYQITFQDHGVGTFVGTLQALNNSATTLRFGGIDTGSTYATYVQTTSTVPLGWGLNDGIYISGIYEVA